MPAQVLQVSADGMTLFYAHGMPAREVAAYAQRFLHGVRVCSPARLVAAAVNAANADAADQAAGVEAPRQPAGLPAAGTGDEPGHGAPGGCIRLFVKTLVGKQVPVSVPRTGTIAHIMRTLEESEDIPAKQQRLIFNGRQLEICSFLQDVDGLDEWAVITLILRLGGC